jgi:hypothetical protein
VFLVFIISSPVVADASRAGTPETTAGWVKHSGNPVLGAKLGTCFDDLEQIGLVTHEGEDLGFESPRADDAPPAAEPPALRPLTFEPLPLGSVRPEGWLKRQLNIQAAGLSGHLDEIWPDLKDSAWTGGPDRLGELIPRVVLDSGKKIKSLFPLTPRVRAASIR